MQILVADPGTSGGQFFDGSGVDLQNLTQILGTFGDLFEVRGVRCGLDDEQLGGGVLENPLRLVGGGGLVDRHGASARGPDGVVEDDPLVARRAEDGDAVAEFDTGGDQSLGCCRDLCREPSCGDVGPVTVLQTLERYEVGRFLLVPVDGVGHGCVVRNGERRRHRIFAHCWTPYG